MNMQLSWHKIITNQGGPKVFLPKTQDAPIYRTTSTMTTVITMSASVPSPIPMYISHLLPSKGQLWPDGRLNWQKEKILG